MLQINNKFFGLQFLNKIKYKMMSNTIIKLRRLEKQQQSLIKDPLANVLVKRDGERNFYFCIYGLDGVYKGGFYYGLLQLHQNYPFAAPKLFFYTPSGRFQLNLPICTSFTNYHQQSWTSAWNVRSLLLGTVSFMTSDEGSYGCRTDSNEVKALLATKSLQYNVKIKKFCQLFEEQLKQVKPPISSRIIEIINQTMSSEPQSKTFEPLNFSNQAENVILPLNPNPDPNNNQIERQIHFANRNKCKKILVFCGIAVPVICFVVYIVMR